MRVDRVFSGLFVALLAIVSNPADAANVYLNQQISGDCVGVYNASAGTCGGGSDTSYDTPNEIESWLTSQGAGTDTIYLVGSDDPDNPAFIQLEQGTNFDLSGNQCDGLNFLPDPNFPYHYITAHEDATLWNWRAEYAASADSSHLGGTVYSAPLPPTYTVSGDPGIMMEDVDDTVKRMKEAYLDGTLREWDSVSGNRWMMHVADANDTNKDGRIAKRMYHYSQHYSKDGRIYYLTADGGPPNETWTGAARTLRWVYPNRRFFTGVKCSDVVMDGVNTNFTMKIMTIAGNTSPVIKNSTFGMAGNDNSYYPINIDEAGDGTTTKNLTYKDNFHILTGAAYRNHRSNAIYIGWNEDCYVSGLVSLLAGGHGDYAHEHTDRCTVFDNFFWGSGGKAFNGKGVEDADLLYNRFGWMHHSVCNFENTPANHPRDTEGTCPKHENSTNIGETENHYNAQVDGTRNLIIGNWFTSRAGGLVQSSRASWSMAERHNRDSRSLHNFFYRPIKGDKYTSRYGDTGSSGKGDKSCMKLYDGGGDKAGPISDYVSINDACIDPLQQWPGGTSKLGIEAVWTYPGLSNGSLDGRNVEFRGTWINDGTARVPGRATSCSGFAGDPNVTDTTCSDVSVKVTRWDNAESVNFDLRPTDNTWPGNDNGVAPATAIGSGSASTTLTVSDIHVFPDSFLTMNAAQQALFAADANAYMAAMIPSAYWSTLSAGEWVVQIGANIYKYNAVNKTGPGTQGTLTLTAPQSWNAGDTVSPVTFSGTPDQGIEYYGAAPDTISAINDSFNINISSTVDLPVCVNDRGTGTGASGFRIKPSSLVESSSLITGLVVNPGNDCEARVTVSATPGSATFLYQLEKISEGLESNTASVTLQISETVGGVGEQVIVFNDAPTNLSTVASWTLASLTPDDAKAVYVEAWTDSGTGAHWGVRAADDATDRSQNLAANSRGSLVSPTDSNGDIDYYQASAMDGFQTLAYFTNSTDVTIEGYTSVALTCDDTWNTISETGHALVVYDVPEAEAGNAIAFAMDSTGGFAPVPRTTGKQHVLAVPNSSENVEYKCPATGGVDELRRILTVATGSSIIKPSAGDFERFRVATSPGKATVQPADFACTGPCYGYVVYTTNDSSEARRFNIATLEGDASSNDEGNNGHRWQFVRADSEGKFGIASNVDYTDFYVIGAISEGSAPTSAPLVLELSTCPTTTDMDGRAPDTSVHGGSIKATDTTVQCDSGDVDLPADQAFAVQTGVGNYQIDFKVEEASGILYVEDLNPESWHDYASGPFAPTAGFSLKLDFDSGIYGLRALVPGEVNLGDVADLPNLISAEGDAYVRLTSTPNIPWTQQTIKLYLSASPITAQNAPIAQAIYVGPTRVDNGILQFRQEGSDIELGLASQSVTVRSTVTPDSSAPTAATVSSQVSGNLVDLTWTAPADNGNSTVSRVSSVRVLRDTTPTPTPTIAYGIDPRDELYQDNVGAGTYYFRVCWADASGNEACSADESATTVAPNTPPTVSSPASITVPVGVDYPSDVSVVNIKEACAATDIDGDTISVSRITAGPTNATATTRVDSEYIDYLPDQGETADDQITVKLRDTTGGESADCVINITHQAPPFINPVVAFTDRDAPGILVNWRISAWESGVEYADFASGQSGFTPPQSMHRSGTLSYIDCATVSGLESHVYDCGQLTISLQRDDLAKNFETLPEIGSTMLFSGRAIKDSDGNDILAPGGKPITFSFPVTLEQ